MINQGAREVPPLLRRLKMPETTFDYMMALKSRGLIRETTSYGDSLWELTPKGRHVGVMCEHTLLSILEYYDSMEPMRREELDAKFK